MWCYFDRYEWIRFTSAEPERILNKLTAESIELGDIEWVDFLTVQIKVKHVHLMPAKNLFEAESVHYQVIGKSGMLWRVFNICSRPVLLLGLFLFIFLASWLPGRVLFVEIKGNENVSEKLILQNMESCGFHIGMESSKLRSEEMKNMLLGKIPDLQWIGITTSGCVATIHVKERSFMQEKMQMESCISSIIASHDGIISEMTIYSGNPLVKVGDSIKAGDILISGYTDCGIKTIAQRSAGEVFAHTKRSYGVLTPIHAIERREKTDERVCYRLQIGKKVINFCNHSGISDSTCDKMYVEYYWPFSEDFRLPVSLVKIVSSYYDSADIEQTVESIHWVQQWAREYLLSKMIAGDILQESHILNTGDDYYEFIGTYACHEMIALEKYEEIVG